MPKTNAHEYKSSILAVIDCGMEQELLNGKRIWYNTDEIFNIYDDYSGFVDVYKVMEGEYEIYSI